MKFVEISSTIHLDSICSDSEIQKNGYLCLGDLRDRVLPRCDSSRHSRIVIRRRLLMALT